MLVYILPKAFRWRLSQLAMADLVLSHSGLCGEGRVHERRGQRGAPLQRAARALPRRRRLGRPPAKEVVDVVAKDGVDARVAQPDERVRHARATEQRRVREEQPEGADWVGLPPVEAGAPLR